MTIYFTLQLIFIGHRELAGLTRPGYQIIPFQAEELRYVIKVTMFVNMMSFFCYFFEFVRNLLSCDLAARYIIVLIMFSYWVYMWLLHYHFPRDFQVTWHSFSSLSPPSLYASYLSQSSFNYYQSFVIIHVKLVYN